MSKELKEEIKKYIIMGLNAEGIKEKNALKQSEIVWNCIEPILEKWQEELREKNIKIKRLKEELENALKEISSLNRAIRELEDEIKRR